LDAVGVVARHVEDLALMLGLIAGPDPRDPSAASVAVPDYLAKLETPVKGLKVGLDERLVSEAHADVQRMVSAVLGILTTAGLKQTSCTFADWQTIDHLTQLVQLPDAAAVHGNYIRTRPNDYGPQVRSRIEFGHFISAVDHLAAMRARGTYLERVLDQTFKDIDVAILPVLADPLPTIAELDVGGGPKLQSALGRIVKFLRPINYLGLPVLTLPAPRNGGLPNGIQLIGKPFAEGLLMAIGQAYQRHVPPEIARPFA
jgi:aspartyl-tRNA(Asn)/glutamyl-tRNA(Gln) amidotransferase subunit A